MEKARSYSALFIIDPAKKDAIDEVKQVISEVITSNTGSITKENMMGLRELAYPIKKKSSGVYIEVIFNAMPDSISKMSREFRINTNILRSLIDKIV